ncbi:Abi-like protein [Rhodococcus rhodochrous J38]|uniref:Abi family protein n=1 Tax=Rhodococcus rhodochrous TaxID=1829 RepID=UPI00119D7D7B|nr:Abi family protein [Rhodococcus rhodochrous]TWH52617.1 Abi-like protein [Rhodococcus rhodochrous J38]
MTTGDHLDDESAQRKLEHASTRRAAALDKAISADRIASYHAAAHGNPTLARQLYVWDRDVAVAILADLAILEVALRNAIHTVLSADHGARWYETIPLDDRSQSQIVKAWESLQKQGRKADPADPATPGWLVAQSMFGTWVNLLDEGSYAGRLPRRQKISYEDLWRTSVHRAFPGVRVEARKDPDPDARPTRTWVHSIAKTVNVLRNRVAHHEPLHNGFPLPGQRSHKNQPSRRLSAREGYDTYMTLARMIDRDLAEWIGHDTTVPDLLLNKPSSSI